MLMTRPFPTIVLVIVFSLTALILTQRAVAQVYLPYGGQGYYGYDGQRYGYGGYYGYDDYDYDYPRRHHYYYWPQRDLLPHWYDGPDPGIYWNEKSWQGQYGYSRPRVRDRRSFRSGYDGPVRTYPGGPVIGRDDDPPERKGHSLRGQPGGRGKLRTG
ncbi:MAG: hypothetical protein HPY44_18165 [Armatimonadetes bacterium]|nr:hypothetical protein [Armatimonadota bacterium]